MPDTKYLLYIKEREIEMDISYYKTGDREQKRKRNRKFWNVCKMILTLILLIVVIYGCSQYLMTALNS